MDAVVRSAFHDFSGYLETHVRVFRYARFVVGNGHHRGAVPGDQGQYRFQPLLFAGNGIDQGLTLVDGKAGFQGRDNGGVDGQGHIRDRLHQFHSLRQDRRFVSQWDAGIYVQHVGAGFNLGDGVSLHAAVITLFHLVSQDFATGGIDPLADDHEGPVKPDNDLPGCRTYQCLCHCC